MQSADINIEFVKQRIENLEGQISDAQNKKQPVRYCLRKELDHLKICLKCMTSTSTAEDEEQIAKFLESMRDKPPVLRLGKRDLTPRKVALPEPAPRKKAVPEPQIMCEPGGAIRMGRVLYPPFHFKIWTDPNGVEHFVYTPHSLRDREGNSWWNRVVFMIPGVYGVYHGKLNDPCFRSISSLWNKVEAFQQHAWFAKVFPPPYSIISRHRPSHPTSPVAGFRRSPPFASRGRPCTSRFPRTSSSPRATPSPSGAGPRTRVALSIGPTVAAIARWSTTSTG